MRNRDESLAFGFALGFFLTLVHMSAQADGWKPDEPWMPNKADEPDVDDLSGPPNYTMPRGWWGLSYGRSVECPKCGARNRVRRGDYAETHNVEGGGQPVTMKFKVRSRDSAIYCWPCDQTFFRMSEDTVMRHFPPDERAA